VSFIVVFDAQHQLEREQRGIARNDGIETRVEFIQLG
jgi:hypothetical protein